MNRNPKHPTRLLVALGLLLAMLLPTVGWAAINLEVVDQNGAPVTNYRWLLEEDNTALTTPGTPRNDTVSLVIHKSHAPVLATGSGNLIDADPAGRYALTVMAGGHQLGGANVAVGQTSVKVVLNAHPIPTSQINILVFQDHNPINNVPDAGEPGLPAFRIVLADFAGGPILEDAFGNPLGTTYRYYQTGDLIPPGSAIGDAVLDADGAPEILVPGDGFIYTDQYGRALVKNLPMGKFGIQAIPPNGSDWTGGHGTANVKNSWNQTATIEGTRTVDAWVKANEPMLFMEGFGPGFYHAFFGFVKPDGITTDLLAADPDDPMAKIGQPNQPGNVTVTGVNRFNHFGRPPVNQQFAVGPAVTAAWIGLNEINALGLPGRGLYAAPCDNVTGEFSISNVPPGTYQLVTWDTPLDALFGFNTIVVPAGQAEYDLGNVLSYRWFGTLQGTVFYDDGGGDPNSPKANNGYRDQIDVDPVTGEPIFEAGIPEQNINIRWRDGTIYQAQPTDGEGGYAFTEVFPFFKWLVAEVDFLRFKATGMTAIVDEGGEIPTTGTAGLYAEGVRNPQPQYVLNADGTQSATPDYNPYSGIPNDNLSRTEPGAVLTEAVHLFLNQNNRIDWGKNNYGPGENGGISGVIGYQTTRAEEDPRFGVNDAWEPGVPRVQVALYADTNTYTLNPDLTITVTPGSDKIIDDLNGDGHPTPSDVDNHPLGWADGGPKGLEDFDHNGNGAFDLGDAIQVTWTDSFDDVVADDPTLGAQQPNPPVILGKPIIGSDNYATWNQVRPQIFDGGYAFGDVEPGNYIVQAFPPPGYLILTEESMNVGYGDAYVPSTLALPPELVGTADNHVGDGAYLATILPTARASNPFVVPDQLTMFPGSGDLAPFAGVERPLADMKFVRVADGFNAAADFHVYTEVPKSTRVVGFVLNDLTAEFNAASPIFGEKGSPGWLPISFRDWTGREVARTYSDEYGSYNALVPSTYTVNAPAPSGVAPNMLTMVLNDPTMPDPANPNNRMADPNYNPAFATTPWTLHYYPGTFLYADTPIVPLAGFTGEPNKQLDVEPVTGTPVIQSIEGALDPNGTGLRGAWVNVLSPNNQRPPITLTSLGTVQVPDPNSIGYGSNNTVPRDFGFGTTAGTVRLYLANGTANLFRAGNSWNCPVSSWSDSTIVFQTPNVNANSDGVTFGASGTEWLVVVTRGDTGQRSPIGVTLTYEPDLNKVHFVAPNTTSPTPSVIQDAIDSAAPGDLILVTASSNEYNENPILWKPLRLQGSGLGTIINANTTPAERLTAWHNKVAEILGGDPFLANEAPGIMVLGQNVLGAGGALSDSGFDTIASRIDGFQIKGAIAGGGIAVWHKATNLRISNNRLIGNQGSFAGGITLGMFDNLGTTYDNQNVLIELNQIFKNAGVNSAGGIGIYTGANGYRIQNNYIEGNFSRGYGGGIGHEGLSPGGLIAGNTIAFNEVFYGLAVGGDGGGIYLGGIPAPGGLSTGSGSVSIVNNLIQGNLAGSGHGGGIRAAGFNGVDVQTSPTSANWYALNIQNNMIVNNAAGFGGGGISLQDATRVSIVGNTIANNDSTATAKAAFPAGALDSTPQGAGIVGHPHSALLAALTGVGTFSNPALTNNIVWHNRSFYYDGTAQALAPDPAAPVYSDLAVAGGVGAMTPVNCLLSDGNPSFAGPYVNTLFTALIVDEAGNNLAVRFEPIGLNTPAGIPLANYHINAGSGAINNALNTVATVAFDFDFQNRAQGLRQDIGADERSGNTNPANTAFAYTSPAQVGPLPLDVPPAVTTPITGPNVVPGPQVRPGDAGIPTFNPDPGQGTTMADRALDATVIASLDKDPTADENGNGDPTDDVDYYHLAAGDGFATMASTEPLYTFGFSDVTGIQRKHVFLEGTLKANIAAPTLIFHEGNHAYLDLSNVGMLMRPDLFDPHTVHFHGFPNAASVYDGEPMASISVNMGATLRYYYNIVEPGTYLYHCHVEATEHMQMGMIGNLFVYPKQNNADAGTVFGTHVHAAGDRYAYNDGDGSTYYDVELPLQISGFDANFHRQHILVQPLPFAALYDDYPMLNGRGYPDTIKASDEILTDVGLEDPYNAQPISSALTAQVGDKILLRMSNVSVADFHTFTIQGLKMKVVGKDARLLRGPTGADLTYTTTSMTLGGGESADAIVDTTGAQPGTYFIYTTRLHHLSNEAEDYGGIMTEITLTP